MDYADPTDAVAPAAPWYRRPWVLGALLRVAAVGVGACLGALCPHIDPRWQFPCALDERLFH